MGAFGAVIASALVGTAIYRDFEAQAHELFFTTRLSRAAYFFGRFLGALVVTLFVYSGLLFGVLLGSLMPWVDKNSLGAFRIESYVNVFLVILLPNVLFLSTLFFVFGTLTRSLLAIYLQGVLVFVGWAISLALLGSVENRLAASLFDPFGLASTSVVTRYWTLAEKNSTTACSGWGWGSARSPSASASSSSRPRHWFLGKSPPSPRPTG
jgi:ABC-type transport system involved in multi-copper enzyme maturation permease subunit